MTDGPGAFDAEDAKLITLARATAARTGATQAAAVRDADGRTYAAAPVRLPSLRLTALQLAVAMALSSGATGLEAAVVLAGDLADADPDGARAVAEVSPSAPVYRVAADGTPLD
ncbi:MAG TPA: cytidine deaminase [Jatrophihabitans sp.]|nr:cytidine deaminase [Jatrophihabitans sp.]